MILAFNKLITKINTVVKIIAVNISVYLPESCKISDIGSLDTMMSYKQHQWCGENYNKCLCFKLGVVDELGQCEKNSPVTDKNKEDSNNKTYRHRMTENKRHR